MQKIDNWGQDVLIPSREEWESILEDKKYNDYELSSTSCDLAKSHLEYFRNSPEVVLALVGSPQKNFYYLTLLKINDILYRVHFENVICEHCNEISGMSATPDYVAYAGARRAEEARQAMEKLPVMSCKHCGEKLNRRHTIWFLEN